MSSVTKCICFILKDTMETKYVVIYLHKTMIKMRMSMVGHVLNGLDNILNLRYFGTFKMKKYYLFNSGLLLLEYHNKV